MTINILNLFNSKKLAPENNEPMTPQIALKRLMEGNKRYRQDKLTHPHCTKESRQATAKDQRPFAIVLGCSDSRASPEIVFDEGIGDIFVVRVAGNVVGPIEMNSIEFSVDNLQPSLIFIMGHENCGAVDAVLKQKTHDMGAVADLIRPAVAASAHLPGNPIENAVKTNVRMIVYTLKKTAFISKLIEENKIDVVGGYYHLASGEVEVLRG